MPDPFVEWEEQYGSAALNQKFVGIISPGVYLGYDVSLSGTPDSVDVSTPTSGRSVAVVQRDGFSITVVEESAVTLEVPATNQLYHVVVEAQYQMGQATTSQLKVVADGDEASHHVIVGSIERSGGTLQQPTETYREDRVPRGGFSEVINALQVVNAGDAGSIQAGLLGDRPPAGEKGRLWLAITEREWYWDDGTEWRGIGSANNTVLNEGGVPSIQAGLLADRPTAGTEGRLYVSTDEPRLYRDTGSAWEPEGLTTRDLTQPIRNKLKLSADTGPAENIQSNQATFVAQVLSLRSIPADAGPPVKRIFARKTGTVYPRGCGATFKGPQRTRSPEGLSPRMRGHPDIVAGGDDCERSIPACAGPPRTGRAGTRRSWVYPRVCGATRSIGRSKALEIGLSPRVRGHRLRLKVSSGMQGSIPACAGPPAGKEAGPYQKQVYPRVCGATSMTSVHIAASLGLSPRVRGHPG